MNPLYQKWAISAVRGILKAASGYFVAKGWSKAGLDAETMTGVASFIVLQGWSWWEDHGDIVMQLVTQRMAGVTRAHVEAVVKQSVALPPATTPKDVVPVAHT